MENHDNEQRLRILQERLGQIKNKQEANREQVESDNTPPYPTYNPKATQSSDEDIALEQTKIAQPSSSFPWRKVFAFLIIVSVGFGGFYLYENFDFTSLLPKTTNSVEVIAKQKEVVTLQYSLDFGAAQHLILLSSFDTEEAAKIFSEQKTSAGYASSYFFLPSVSNSQEKRYQVYLGPYFSESEAKQWANTLESEFELLNL